MIVAEFSVIPMGAGTSASRYIRAVHEMLRNSGIRFVPGAMSTAIETNSIEQVCMIIERANKILAEMGVQRVITTLKIDYRLDKDISIETKLKALESKS